MIYYLKRGEEILQGDQENLDGTRWNVTGRVGMKVAASHVGGFRRVIDERTVEEITAESNLIQACQLIGAKYHRTHIDFADNERVKVSAWENSWHISRYPFRAYVLQTSEPRHLQIVLLKMHLKILEEISCGPTHKG